MTILTIDVGGSSVKVLCSTLTAADERKAPTGPGTTPSELVDTVKALTHDWHFDVIAIGIPTIVRDGEIVAEPQNLGEGWIGFDFQAAFGRPVRLINDAAMQALGSYRGGRMLFLGLGTGLGTAMVVDGIVLPMELAHLPYRKDRSYEEYLSQASLDARGKHKWQKHVWRVVALFRTALQPDEVVIGGGNVAHLDAPPEGVRLGDNDFAYIGGFRLWQGPAGREQQ